MLPLRLLLPAALFLVGSGTDILPAPTKVRFLAETFRHLLHWEPAHRLNRPAELSYDVQYQQYGSSGWTPAQHCTRIPGDPCDLSLQTGRPDGYYYARVRAVAGGSASNWTLSPRFSPKEAMLRLLNVSLSLHGNTIRVSVRPPLGQGANNLSFQDLYSQWTEFHAHVRSSFDNRQFVHVGNSLEFDLPPLLWGQRYCVRVQPHVSSRPLPAKPTEEQCVSIPALPQEEDLGPSLSLLSLVPLGVLAFGLGLAWAYVKKPMETPGVLASLLPKKPPSPEGAGEGSLPGGRLRGGLEEVVLLSMEREAIQPLCFLGLEGLRPPVAERPIGLATPPLGKNCWRSESPGLWKNLLDTSRGSTDSGICLQDPSDNLSFFLGALKLSLGSHERDGRRFQVDAGGLRSEEQLPLMATSETKERLPLGDPPKACFSTYQCQSGATLEVAAGTGGVALAEPGMATGYLKQASLGVVLPARDLMEATPTGVLPSHPNLRGLPSSGLLQDASSPALDVS